MNRVCRARSGGARRDHAPALPTGPGPLEAYAARFDELFGSLAQRRGFRAYLAGLLLPRSRNKTLTCLAGVEPVTGAQQPAVQRLQFFLSESTWDHEQVNARRLALLLADPVTAPHAAGGWSSTIPGTARTARRPPTSGGSGWAG